MAGWLAGLPAQLAAWEPLLPDLGSLVTGRCQRPALAGELTRLEQRVADLERENGRLRLGLRNGQENQLAPPRGWAWNVADSSESGEDTFWGRDETETPETMCQPGQHCPPPALEPRSLDLVLEAAAGVEGGYFACVRRGASAGLVPGAHGPVAVRLGSTRAKGDEQRALLREVQTHCHVVHAHLVPVLAVCLPRAALVYPWADGSLEDLVRAAPPGPADGLRLLWHASCGLGALHAQGLVHCDVRSAKVLLFRQEDGTTAARLGGCGSVREAGSVPPVACRASPATLMAASPYADPLHLLTGHFAAASDVFSLGVVLLEALLGRSAAPPREDPESTAAGAEGSQRSPPLWQEFRQRLPIRHQAMRATVFAGAAAHVVQEQAPRGGEWKAEVLLEAVELVGEMLELRLPEGGGHLPDRPPAESVAGRLEAALVAQSVVSPRQRLCVICMDSPANTRVVPCQHSAHCQSCAAQCMGRQEPCPICRGAVHGFETGSFQATFTR